MAYPFEKIPMPLELSGRKRITNEQRQQMQLLRGQGWTYTRIASEFNVSATAVQRVCKPEYAAAQDAIYKNRGYDKEKQTMYTRRSRAKRKELFDYKKRQWKENP